MFKFPFKWRQTPSQENSTPVKPPKRRKASSEASDARALAGAIALGLVFALALTIAASWAPESIAQRAMEPSVDSSQPLGKS